jgi:hypothetical protein
MANRQGRLFGHSSHLHLVRGGVVAPSAHLARLPGARAHGSGRRGVLLTHRRLRQRSRSAGCERDISPASRNVTTDMFWPQASEAEAITI